MFRCAPLTSHFCIAVKHTEPELHKCIKLLDMVCNPDDYPQSPSRDRGKTTVMNIHRECDEIHAGTLWKLGEDGVVKNAVVRFRGRTLWKQREFKLSRRIQGDHQGQLQFAYHNAKEQKGVVLLMPPFRC